MMDLSDLDALDELDVSVGEPPADIAESADAIAVTDAEDESD